VAWWILGGFAKYWSGLGSGLVNFWQWPSEVPRVAWWSPGQVPTMARLSPGWVPTVAWWNPEWVLMTSWLVLVEVWTRSRRCSDQVSTKARWGSSECSNDGLPVVRRFKYEKVKLEKWFTKFKNRNHFSKLKNFFLFFCQIENIFALTIIFWRTKHRKMRKKFHTIFYSETNGA